MSTENIVSKKFRILSDATNKVWNRISFWCKASDVEFNSGKNAQTTLGSITGISDSLTSTSSNVAASAYAVKQLNDKITKLNSDLNFKKFLGGVQYIKFVPGSYSIKEFINDAFTLSTSGRYSSVNTFTANIDCKIKRLFMYSSGANSSSRPFKAEIKGTTYDGNQDVELNVSLSKGETFTITSLLASNDDTAIIYIELA